MKPKTQKLKNSEIAYCSGCMDLSKHIWCPMIDVFECIECGIAMDEKEYDKRSDPNYKPEEDPDLVPIDLNDPPHDQENLLN